MEEKRCESKFELCLKDISETDAWMLTYIMIHLLKEHKSIKKVYQMMLEEPGKEDGEIEIPIDFDFMDNIRSHGECKASALLKARGVLTHSDLTEFVFNHDPDDKIYGIGVSGVSSIIAYMIMKHIIDKKRIIEAARHFVKRNSEIAEIYRMTCAKCSIYGNMHELMEGLPLWI